MPRLDDTSVPARIARRVHGAQWCEYHVPTGRLFIWHGLHHVSVVDLATGEESERWPIQVTGSGFRPYRDAVASTVLERLEAGY